MLPANCPEHEAVPSLTLDIASHGLVIDSLYIDRAYIASELVADVLARDGQVVCRPWIARNGEYFTKQDFRLNLQDRTIVCPAGQVQPIVFGETTRFPAEVCKVCPMRPKCTNAKGNRGRTVSIARDEPLQQELHAIENTPAGRERLRERIPIEHRQAHTCKRQGPKARYVGARKNLFDTRRAAVITNLQLIQRRIHDKSKIGIANRGE